MKSSGGVREWRALLSDACLAMDQGRRFDESALKELHNGIVWLESPEDKARFLYCMLWNRVQDVPELVNTLDLPIGQRVDDMKIAGALDALFSSHMHWRVYIDDDYQAMLASFFFEKGASLDTFTFDGHPILNAAAACPSDKVWEVVASRLLQMAEAEKVVEDDCPKDRVKGLHISGIEATSRSTTKVQELINCRSEIIAIGLDGSRYDGQYPLHILLNRNVPERAKFLCKLGANPFLKDRRGLNAVYMAYEKNNLTAFKYLLDEYPMLLFTRRYVISRSGKPLRLLDYCAIEEAEDGGTEFLQAVLDHLKERQVIQYHLRFEAEGMSILRRVAGSGLTHARKVCECLMDYGADPYWKDEDGVSAMSAAGEQLKKAMKQKLEELNEAGKSQAQKAPLSPRERMP